MKRVSYLFNLFYPKVCMCCDTHLLDQETLICLACQFDLPFVDNGDFIRNPVTKIFDGRVPIEMGASFLFYHEIGKTKQLIHELKYKGNENVGVYLANWFGKQLTSSQLFASCDCIVPVPLHRSKLKQRGYNQLTQFGRQLSKLIEVPYNETILQRISFTKTQTKKKRLDRFQNTHSRFVVEQPELISNKHILLIDDVITTGATLESCCRELLKGENVKISILTMAITE